MALLPDRRQRIKRRIETLQAQLDAIDDAITNRLTEGGGYVAGYNFSDGQGSQQMTYVRVSDLMEKQRYIESQIEMLYRKLNGTGLHTITTVSYTHLTLPTKRIV